jgi:PadR family transcriptional regulator, regulatory protein PadR
MPEKMFERELKRGTLEMILLRLLLEKPMYGYELITTLEQRGGEIFTLKEGTLYPVLYRLEEAGLITSRWETLDRGVPRKYYALTDGGSERLRSMVADWMEFAARVTRLVELEEKGDEEKYKNGNH